MYRRLCLLTFNGKLLADTPMTLKNDKIRKKIKNRYFSVKKVRNFFTIKINGLSAFICAYSKASFKITFAESLHFKEIIQNLEWVVSKFCSMLQILYCDENQEVIETKVCLTQVAVNLQYDNITDKKISYELLKKKYQIIKNQIIIEIDECSFVHNINYISLEESGSSSYFFSIIHEGKRIASLKTFVNQKQITYIYDLRNMELALKASENFLRELSKIND